MIKVTDNFYLIENKQDQNHKYNILHINCAYKKYVGSVFKHKKGNITLGYQNSCFYCKQIIPNIVIKKLEFFENLNGYER